MTKVSKKSVAAFMAAVLAPIPDADLTDKELSRLEERARRDAKKRAANRWEQGMCLVRLAIAERDVLTWRWAAAGRKGPNPGGDCRALRDEVARQMAIAAPDKTALRWKEGYRTFWGMEKDFAPLIEADKARLGI